jgi:protein-L-isoaspartate O-methyltransferase
VNDDEAVALRHRLADRLTHEGLLPARWRTAFQDVPRHRFLPRYWRLTANNMHYQPVAAGDPGWLKDIYRNIVLPTQLDGDSALWERARAAGTPILGTPTSSSSMPSLMASMLDALDVADGAGCWRSAPEPATTPPCSATDSARNW